MAQGISRRAARSRRPKKLKEDLAQVPFRFACAARVVRRIAPRVGDESFFLRRWWLVRANKIIPWSLCGRKSKGRPNQSKSWPRVG